MNGIVIIDKPQDWTSQDVTARLRRVYGTRRIGHGGTLDPMATGVLPVFVGRATRGVEFFEHARKEYVTLLRPGLITDTQDTTGTVLEQHSVELDNEKIEVALQAFRGDIMQIPPMYSALKVNGQKLCDLARKGRTVERQPRPITIHTLEYLGMENGCLKLRVDCSKGTYIRSLCADIGEKLCCGGTMQSLVRTRVGEFRLADALTLAQLQELRDTERLEEALLPTDRIFSDFPMLHVEKKWRKLIDNGNAFYPGQTVEQTTHPAGEWVRIYREDDSFVGIYAYDETKEWYKPVKIFPSNTESRK